MGKPRAKKEPLATTDRDDQGHLGVDLTTYAREIERTFNEAGSAFTLATESQAVTEIIPALGVAIDRMLDVVQLATEMVGILGYYGGTEVDRLKRENDELRGGFSSSPIPRGMTYAPFDGNVH